MYNLHEKLINAVKLNSNSVCSADRPSFLLGLCLFMKICLILRIIFTFSRIIKIFVLMFKGHFPLYASIQFCLQYQRTSLVCFFQS